MMAKVRALFSLLLLLTASWTAEGSGNGGIGRSPVVDRRRPSWLGGGQLSHTRRQPAGQDPVGGEPLRGVDGDVPATQPIPFVTPTPTARLELRQGPGGGPGGGPGKGTAERPPGAGGGPGGGPGGGGRGGQNGPENCPTEQQLSSISSSAASALAEASLSFSATLAALSTQSSNDVAAAAATALASASSDISSAQAAAAAASSQVARVAASASAVSSSLVASASSVIAAVRASAAAAATLAPVTLPPTTVTVTLIETTVQVSMTTTTMTDVITEPSAKPDYAAHADTGDVASSSNLSHGQLAATLVGSVIGAAAFTFLFVFVYFRRRRDQGTVIFDDARSSGYRPSSQTAMRAAEPPSAIFSRDEKRNLDGAQLAELSVSPRPFLRRHPSDVGTTIAVGTDPARSDKDPIDFRQWALRSGMSGTGSPGPEPQPVRLQLARKNSIDGTSRVQAVRVPVGDPNSQNPRDSMQNAGRTNFRPPRASATESFYSTDIPPPPWAVPAPERAQRQVVSSLGPLPPRRSSGQAPPHAYSSNDRLQLPPEIPRHENVTSWGSWGSALVGTQLDSHMVMLLKQPPLGQPNGSRGPSPTGDDADADANAVGRGPDDVSPPASPHRHQDLARGTLMSLSTRDSHTIPLSFTPLVLPGHPLQFPRKSLPTSRPQMPLAVSQPQLQPAAPPAPSTQQQQQQQQQQQLSTPQYPAPAGDGTSPGFAPSYAATSRASSYGGGGNSRPSTGAGPPGGLRPPPPFSLFPSPGPAPVPAPLVPGGGGMTGLGIQQQARRLSVIAAALRDNHNSLTTENAARASGGAGGGGGGGGGSTTPSRFH